MKWVRAVCEICQNGRCTVACLGGQPSSVAACVKFNAMSDLALTPKTGAAAAAIVQNTSVCSVHTGTTSLKDESPESHAGPAPDV